jgi:hypothetical protein
VRQVNPLSTDCYLHLLPAGLLLSRSSPVEVPQQPAPGSTRCRATHATRSNTCSKQQQPAPEQEAALLRPMLRQWLTGTCSLAEQDQQAAAGLNSMSHSRRRHSSTEVGSTRSGISLRRGSSLRSTQQQQQGQARPGSAPAAQLASRCASYGNTPWHRLHPCPAQQQRHAWVITSAAAPCAAVPGCTTRRMHAHSPACTSCSAATDLLACRLPPAAPTCRASPLAPSPAAPWSPAAQQARGQASTTARQRSCSAQRLPSASAPAAALQAWRARVRVQGLESTSASAAGPPGLPSASSPGGAAARRRRLRWHPGQVRGSGVPAAGRAVVVAA